MLKLTIEEREQGQLVLDRLRGFVARIDALFAFIDKKALSRDDVEHAQSLLRSLKSDLKESAKQRNADRRRGQINEFESAFFDLPVAKAAAYLTVAVNSHPHRSSWMSCLYGVRMDLDMPRANLEEVLRE